MDEDKLQLIDDLISDAEKARDDVYPKGGWVGPSEEFHGFDLRFKWCDGFMVGATAAKRVMTGELTREEYIAYPCGMRED